MPGSTSSKTDHAPAEGRRQERGLDTHKLAEVGVCYRAALVGAHHVGHGADRVDLDREPARLGSVVQRRLHVDYVAEGAGAPRALAGKALRRLRCGFAGQQAHAVGVRAHKRREVLCGPQAQPVLEARAQHALCKLGRAKPRRHPRALVLAEAREHEVLMPHAAETCGAARGVPARADGARALHALPAERGAAVYRGSVRRAVAARAAPRVPALGDPVRGQRQRKRPVACTAGERRVHEHGGGRARVRCMRLGLSAWFLTPLEFISVSVFYIWHAP